VRGTILCGPAITTSIHSSVDRHLEYSEGPPEFLRPIWENYMAFQMRARPPNAKK
jgi:hypothetical protein